MSFTAELSYVPCDLTVDNTPCSTMSVSSRNYENN
jgi:hypothetical protein